MRSLMRNHASAYAQTTAAHFQPSGAMNSPATAMRVARVWLPQTAISRMRAERMDQKSPRVRVRKIVRWPATARNE